MYDAAGLPPVLHDGSFTLFNSMISPWHQWLDADRYRRHVDGIEAMRPHHRLGARLVRRGPFVSCAFDRMRAMAGKPIVPPPGQETLDALVAPTPSRPRPCEAHPTPPLEAVDDVVGSLDGAPAPREIAPDRSDEGSAAPFAVVAERAVALAHGFAPADLLRLATKSRPSWVWRATPSKMNPSSRLVSGWYWWRATSLSIHFIICSWFSGSRAMRCASATRDSASSQRNTLHAPVAVLRERLVRVQVERHDEAPGAGGNGQRQRLPTARGDPQGRVLQLWLGRGERRGQLAQHLGVSMERVAGGAPGLIRWQRGPGRRHAHTLAPAACER